MALGGRAAESMIFNHVSTGMSLRKVLKILLVLSNLSVVRATIVAAYECNLAL